MAQINRLAIIGSITAAFAMSAAPVAAADIPATSPAFSNTLPSYDVFDEDSLKAERHRYWRYRGYRGHRHRHRVDAGDVLAGVLIIGGIAAIASAASKSERRDRYRDERYRDYRDDRRYDRDDRRTTRRSAGGRGIDGAVDQCLAEIERDVRVDSVDSVDRSGDGWRVTGTIFNGDRFTCRIDENGRIEDVDYGGGFAAAAPVQGNQQHSDERYRAAWAEVDRQQAPAATEAGESDEKLPAYPGGPIDGDLDDSEGDDRYTMAMAPAS
jgi:hypothetical protein